MTHRRRYRSLTSDASCRASFSSWNSLPHKTTYPLSYETYVVGRVFRGPAEFLAASSDNGGPGLAEPIRTALKTTETTAGPKRTIAYSENPRTSGVPNNGELDYFMLAFPKEDGSGVVLSLSEDLEAIDWFRRAVLGQFDQTQAEQPFLLDGLEWEIGRRPIIAAIASTPGPLLYGHNLDRKDACYNDADGTHLRVGRNGVEPVEGELDPSQLYDIVEMCPYDGIRPRYSKRSATFSRTLIHRPMWLSRLLGDKGSFFPSAIAPSYLRQKPQTSGPRYVLGLAVMTMQEHAAVLLKDGQLVGAIEEERISRIRHHGWRSPGRPSFLTAAVDPTLCIEEVFCHRAIRQLLSDEGITLDDVG